TGPVILVVRGAIAHLNSGTSARFDLAMLEALPKTSVTTETAWTNGQQTFEGVSLAELMHFVGAAHRPLTTYALNDYRVQIPAADVKDSGAIIAYRQNGQYMSIADKGPLWIIYPNSLDSKDVQSKMIWQLKAIEVAPQ